MTIAFFVLLWLFINLMILFIMQFIEEKYSPLELFVEIIAIIISPILWISFWSLLSEAGMDKAVIFDWVKRTRLTELRKCVDIAMNVLVDADDDSISESCRVAAEFSEKVQSLTNTYVKEIRKIQ